MEAQKMMPTPELAMLDMQVTRPLSPTAGHGMHQVMVLLFKPKKMWSTRMPREPLQNIPVEPAPQFLALVGASIAPRHRFDIAYVEGIFDKIEYGHFRSRPAVFVCIDIVLKYPPTNIIKGTELEFQFGKEDIQTPFHDNSRRTTAQKCKSHIPNFFVPEELQGLPASSHTTKHRTFKPKLGALSDFGGNGSQVATTEQHRWHVQGRVDDHDSIRDTFSWSIFPNKLSDDSVPRRLRLGMIAFHEHEPFFMDAVISGIIRGKRSNPPPTRAKTQFDPPSPESLGNNVLDEARLKAHVDRKNNEVPDVARDRAMELLRGDHVQPMNYRNRLGGVGQDVSGAAGDAFPLAGDIGGLVDFDGVAADIVGKIL